MYNICNIGCNKEVEDNEFRNNFKPHRKSK